MKLIKTVKEMTTLINKMSQTPNTSIGFVPTMGFLHEGHESLIKRALQNNKTVVISIFVNPAQFGENEDFSKYPRDLDADIKRIETLVKNEGDNNNVIVFTPSADELYPNGFNIKIIPQQMTDILCGKTRPGHFDGVCLIVAKLFNIVRPNNAYFGQKDAQQVVVIKQMVEDLNFNINIVVLPIVRESDGLAKSSRNVYLSGEQRQSATVLYRTLKLVEDQLVSNFENMVQGSVENLSNILKEHQKIAIEQIENEALAKVDYFEILDFRNLKQVDVNTKQILIAVAAFFGSTRLIDNLVVEFK